MSLNFDSSIGNRAFVYKNYPEAESASSQDIFECTSIGPCIPSGSLESGQILCKAEFISIMPLARAHLDLKNNDNGAEDLGLNRTRLGDIAAGESVLKVILSNSKNYKTDEYVYVGGNVTEYKLLWDDGRDSSYNVPPIKVSPLIPPEKYLSCMTVPAGITAYLGAYHSDCGKYPFDLLATKAHAPVVLVSSAAGAVGVIIGQLYKKAGAVVIGVTSTKSKASRLKSDYGFDFAIAYREDDGGMDGGLQRIGEKLKKGRFLVDLYVDNVGAGQLDSAFNYMALKGRILGIGAIAELDGYADETKFKGIFKYTTIIARELMFCGFLVSAHLHRIPEALGRLGSMLSKGDLKTAETVIVGNFQDWAKLSDQMIRGENTFGRVILKVIGK